MDDYKTTSASANPDDWTRTMFSIGADLQAAWYRKGLMAITGCSEFEATLRFFVQETYPPYAASVVTLDPGAWVMAEKRCRYAIEQWKQCLDSGKWPGYPTQTCYASIPAYLEKQWLEKEVRDVL